MTKTGVNGALIGALMGLQAMSAASQAHAELPPEDIGVSETLPEAIPPHWVLVSDGGTSFSRALLFDGDTGQMKGQLDTGYWSAGLEISADAKSIIVNETFFEHGTRGLRGDLVTIYDAKTLLPRLEIDTPPKRMTALSMVHMTGLTNNQAILGITNFTPMQTLTLVDMKSGQVIGEEDIPGCGQVYPAGPDRLMTLCGNGTFLTFSVGGAEDITRTRSQAFFNPGEDPVIVSAAKRGDTWFFASFDGYVHEVDATSDTPVLVEKWSALTDKERRKEWRTSGFQSLALHEQTGKLYTLMHRGNEDTYEEPGEEVWVYDTKARKRLSKIKLEHPTIALAVTRDENPLLFASGFKPIIPVWMLYVLGASGNLADIFKYLAPVVDVYDAKTGKFLHTIEDAGTLPIQLVVP